jgi:hypothetical protein
MNHSPSIVDTKALVACGFALLSQACGAADSGHDPSPETSAKAQQTAEEKLGNMPETGFIIPARTEEKKAPDYISYGSRSDWTIAYINDYLCALEELRGSTTVDGWAGRGLTPDIGAGRWKIAATTSLWVGVDCVRHSSFILPSGSVQSVSPPLQVSVAWGAIASNTLWQGNSFSFLGRLNANMDGLGESVEVTQATTASAFNTLIVDTGRISAMAASAMSYFAGDQEANRTVRLYGYRDGAYRRGSITSSGTYTFTISNFSGYSAFWMPSIDIAFCALTRIQGRLGGGDDRVKNYHRTGQWYSEVSSQHDVTASFRCMAYDQR